MTNNESTAQTERAKIMVGMEYNTKLTEGIVQKLSGIESDVKAGVRQINAIEIHLATLNGKVMSHDTYLKNLDDRVVEERKHREDIKEEIATYQGGTKIIATIWVTVSSIIGGVVTYLFTKS
jgi:uncharacterized protein YwgA